LNARKSHPSFTGHSFDDSRSPVGIFAHDLTPTCNLRAILPVMIKRWCADTGNCHSSLADTSILVRVKVEPHARRQTQTVVGGMSGKKSSCTDSQVVQTTLHCIVNVRGCARRQAVADGDEVSAGNNHQTIGHEL